MGARTVESIAARTLITVREDDTALTAQNTLSTRHVSALVVVDARQEPVGVLSAFDLLRHGSGGATRVKDIMSPTLFSVDADTPVTTAARLMSSSHIHRLLVKKNGKITGLVSLTDVARLVGEVGLRDEAAPDAQPIGKAVDISSPRELVAASLERCNKNGELAKAFYERFINASPEIAQHFKNTDMVKQRRAISGALQLALDAAINKPGSLSLLASQAERHDRRHLNIRPELYDVWLSSLIHAVRQCDPSFNLLLEQAWRVVLGHIIDFMRRRWQ